MSIVLQRKKNSFKPSEETLLNYGTPFAYREAYKELRTNVKYLLDNKELKVLEITSALPGEGKSTTSINTAISLSRVGSKVLLINCDLRKAGKDPVISHNQEGLTEVLNGRVKLSEVLVRKPLGSFDYLPSGSLVNNPSELLGSLRMKRLLERLKEYYDVVICDMPPISLVTDAATLSRYTDGVILVVRQNFTSKSLVRSAKHKLEAVNANVLGSVLTYYKSDSNISEEKSHYGYGYGYGYEYADEFSEKDE